MEQSCSVCGETIETGGYGGLPMKQHYKHKHPEKYYGEDSEKDSEETSLEDYSVSL